MPNTPSKMSHMRYIQADLSPSPLVGRHYFLKISVKTHPCLSNILKSNNDLDVSAFRFKIVLIWLAIYLLKSILRTALPWIVFMSII